MAGILSGNIENLSSMEQNRRWFIGHFIKDVPEFQTEAFEMRWGVEPKGSRDHNTSTEYSAKTLAICIYGKFKLKFPDEAKEILLEKQGDYVFFDTCEGAHDYEALEDSLILTIRWPSQPNPPRTGATS